MWSQDVACRTPVTPTRVLLTATAAMTGIAIPAAAIQVCEGSQEMGQIGRCLESHWLSCVNWDQSHHLSEPLSPTLHSHS